MVGTTAVHPSRAADLSGRAEAAVRSFQDGHPHRPGIPKPTLAETLGISPAVLEALAAATGDLVDDGPTIRTADFRGGLDEAAETAWAGTRAALEEAGLAVPRRTELDLDPEVVHALLRDGDLVAVDEFGYLPAQLDDLVAAVREMPDGFSVADFRDRFGVTRKHAVPLLEWLDRRGITRRDGDVRRIVG